MKLFFGINSKKVNENEANLPPLRGGDISHGKPPAESKRAGSE
jgi:hypothetical protein